jgi:type VI protein secretion system component VasK
MGGLDLVEKMIIVWAVLTAVWVVLLIYRSVRVDEGSEQLFLAQGEEPLAQKQEEEIHKKERIGALLYVFGVSSAVLLVSTVGVWVWRGLGI